MSATVVATPDQVREVKARIHALVQQLTSMCDDQTEVAERRVYQFAVQFLPLSDAVPDTRAQVYNQASTAK